MEGIITPANEIIETVANTSEMGFYHIVIFILILGSFWFIRHIVKDREKTKDKRDAEWVSHLALHAHEQKTISDRLDEFERNLSNQISMLLSFVQSHLKK